MLVECEYFLRLYLLLIKGGGEIVRQIILWGLERQKLTMEHFLQMKKNDICRSDRIQKQEIEILYPTCEISDISKWDVSLLCYIATEFFKKDLKDTEKLAVEKIKDMRNKYSHHASASVDLGTYTTEWMDLTLIIHTIAHEMEKHKRDGLKDLLTNLAKGFDIRAAIEELKELDHSEDISRLLEDIKIEQNKIKADTKDIKEKVQDIPDIKEKVQEISNIKEKVQEISETLLEFKTQLENLGQNTNITNKCRGEIHVNTGDQNAVASAECLMLAAATDNIAKSQYPESHPAVKEKFDKLVENIEEKGVKIEKVTTGSVLFWFECSSISVLLDLIEFFESTYMKNHLNELSAVLEDILGKKVELTAYLLPESFKDTIETLRKMTEKPARSLQFLMTCTGVEGLQHALDVFEGDAASNSLNELAKTISKEVGQTVSLKTSIDIGEMQTAIQSTKQQIENEMGSSMDGRRETTRLVYEHATKEIVNENVSVGESKNLYKMLTLFSEQPGDLYSERQHLELGEPRTHMYWKRHQSPLSSFEIRICPECSKLGPRETSKKENEMGSSEDDRKETTRLVKEHAKSEISKKEVSEGQSEIVHSTTDFYSEHPGELYTDSQAIESLEPRLGSQMYLKSHELPLSKFETRNCSICGRLLSAETKTGREYDTVSKIVGKAAFSETSEAKKSSDMSYDFVCTICSSHGLKQKAYKYCSECLSYLCKMCVNVHTRLLKNHIISDLLDGRRYDETKLTEYQCDHLDRDVSFYCRDHECLGCLTCMTIYHRPCQFECKQELTTKGVKEYTEKKNIDNPLFQNTDIGGKMWHDKTKLIELCSKHQGETVKYYCRSHRFFGCVECMLLDHRTCNIEHLSNIAFEEKRVAIERSTSKIEKFQYEKPYFQSQKNQSRISESQKPNLGKSKSYFGMSGSTLGKLKAEVAKPNYGRSWREIALQGLAFAPNIGMKELKKCTEKKDK